MASIKITSQDYMKMQLDCPKQHPSDKFYFGVAQELAKIASNSKYVSRFGEEIGKEAVLAVVGYYQDVVTDAGLWRSFCTIHQNLYGKWLPFYELGDDYIESELNLTDIRFILWYVAECMLSVRGTLSPLDADIEELAKAMHKPLEEYYDFAPRSEAFDFIAELEIHDPEQAQQVYDFSYWLFWNSYLLRHAANVVMQQSLDEGAEIIRRHPDPVEAHDHLLDLNNRVMQHNVTGPLALHISDWLRAIVDNELPRKHRSQQKHSQDFYNAFLVANNNRPIAFFKDNNELVEFITNKMHRDIPASHADIINDLNGSKYLCMLAFPDGAISIAADVAQFIADDNNPYYNSEVAKAQATGLITNHSKYEYRMVNYLFGNGLVPDARFAWDNGDSSLTLADSGFLTRLYHQPQP